MRDQHDRRTPDLFDGRTAPKRPRPKKVRWKRPRVRAAGARREFTPATTSSFPGPEEENPRARHVRLTGQLQRVWDAWQREVWRTLEGGSEITGDPPASISAQLRHLRKPEFGAHTVNRRHLGNGLYEYQLVPNPTWTWRS